SPEGCAAILWKDATQRERAAEALKLTAPDLLALGLIDAIIPEPPGGAHTDPDGAAAALSETLARHLSDLDSLSPDDLVRRRTQKFLRMGKFEES
ncbi:MAG: acetyl-CoA carboxylase carboxyl transferase subunit alpha, partial [Gemmatimonadales bacterium]|nr:acetyl-CoA carboxylase carboxyl transferase subunit alpha [Gemmatimonadales bacterium]